MYRLIFCDLDGTVLPFHGEFRPAIRDAMQAVIDSGRWITISSGRGFQLLKSFIGVLPMNAPLICCNGCLVVEPATREIIHLEPMPLELAQDLVRWGQREGEQVWVYLDDMQTMLEYSPGIAGATLRSEAGVEEIDDPLSILTRPPHKAFVLPKTPDDIPEVVASMQILVAGRARVVISSPKTIEVMTPGTSKAKAIALVAERLGVRREETMAVGDGDNDIEMLEWAGLAVAMGNGSQAVKAVADWVAPSVDEDGLAVALRKFVLNE